MTVSFINQLTTPVVLLFLSLGFLMIWLQFANLKSALVFALSYFIASLAFVGELFLGLNSTQGVLRLVVDNLYLLSVTTSVIAFASRYNKPVPAKWLFSIHLITSIIIGYLYMVGSDLITKAYIISSACSFMMVLAMPLLRESCKRLIDKVIYYAIGISALQLMLNAAVILSLDVASPLAGLEKQSAFISILNFSVIIISVTIALSLLISYGEEVISGLKIKAETDAMTGLMNRMAFEEEARTQIRLARHSEMALSMIVADIDLFKTINDTYGHATGDRVIKAFGQCLIGSVRVIDRVGRIGGEEFCILLATANDRVAAEIADKARRAFADACYVESDPTKDLTASFGVATYIPGETYEAFFQRADKALYRAKTTGRNRVCVYQEGNPAPCDGVENIKSGKFGKEALLSA